MARLQAVLLALSLGLVAATDGNREILKNNNGCETITGDNAIDNCCNAFDGRTELQDQKCVPAKSGTFGTGNMCEPECYVDGSKSCKAPFNDESKMTSEKDKMYVCHPAAATTTLAATETPAASTTTMTPWDSSASSSADSDSLNSVYSSSFKDDSESSESSADMSGDSSGSTASGSSGSYMPLWMWGILGALGTMACCGIMAAMMKPKPKKVKKPQPKPEPVAEEPPMPELAPLVPVTTSYQQPVITTAQPVMYQQPMMYSTPGYAV